MDSVRSFPHISQSEFDAACQRLVQLADHNRTKRAACGWLSLTTELGHDMQYLKIVKLLPSTWEVSTSSLQKPESSPVDDYEAEQEDDDQESLRAPGPTPAIVYTVVYSSSYSVPVLYINVKDSLFRCPPTQETLYKHIIPPQYKTQAENERVGVLGGITITDHPVTGSPAFFIHPCQTATVLAASRGTSGPSISPVEYLLMWIGAVGGFVGLEVPVEVVQGAMGD